MWLAVFVQKNVWNDLGTLLITIESPSLSFMKTSILIKLSWATSLPSLNLSGRHCAIHFPLEMSGNCPLITELNLFSHHASVQ